MTLGTKLIENYFHAEITEDNKEFYYFLYENYKKQTNDYDRIGLIIKYKKWPKFKDYKRIKNMELILKAIEESKNLKAPTSILDDLSKPFIPR